MNFNKSLIKENGNLIKEMAKEEWNGLMAPNMKENG